MSENKPSRYAQPLANPGLNAAVSVEAKAQPKIDWSVTLTTRNSADAIRWLLSGVDPNTMLAAGALHYWLIGVGRRGEIAFDYIKENGFPAFLPDGRYFYLMPNGFMVVRRAEPLTRSGDAEPGQIVYLPDMGGDTKLYAFVPVGDEFSMLIQNFANRANTNYKQAKAFRKPYVESLVDVRWEVSFEDYSDRSPALSNGTLVLYLPKALHLINTEGKEVGVITGDFLPYGLSVDTKDRIWGLQRHAERLHLVGYDADGKEFTRVEVQVSDVVQPPVALGDGRVGVVSAKQVACVENGKIVWATALPDSTDTLATATADGHLLVKTGVYLLRLDRNGKKVWQLEAPNGRSITSNPVVTADGRVCFATANDVHCLAR